MLVKGLFDKYGDIIAVLVTGSARLDHLCKGGDSLVGRYHYYRLHPLTLPELDSKFQKQTLDNLFRFSGG
jgi:predicted AAA+ superfamily ATPase